MHTDTLTYRCPHCQQLVDVGEGVIGQKVDCPNPRCGKPFRADVPSALPAGDKRAGDRQPVPVRKPSDDEEVIREVHPAMFRNHPLRFGVLSVLLVAGLFGLVASLLWGTGLTINDSEIVGAGLLLLIGAAVTVVALCFYAVWWVQILMTTLTITSERSRLRRGIFSRETSEVRHTDVRNLQVDQNVLQRVFGVGEIAISSAGQDDMEIAVRAIPRPGEIASLIRERQ